MSSSSIGRSSRGSIIQKVLVLGNNPARMSGFVNIISGDNMAYHLYSSLGVGIGVARTHTKSLNEIVMQLWLIPPEEKVNGLNRSFMKGSSGAIIVIEGGHIEQLDRLLRMVNTDASPSVIVIVVGNERQSLKALKAVNEAFGVSLSESPEVDAHTAFTEFGELLAQRYHLGKNDPIVLSVSDVPEYHPIQGGRKIPECTQEEIEYMRTVIRKIGASSTESTATLIQPEGAFTIDLRNGTVNLQPITCQFCFNKCSRETGICIIELKSGWSSEGLGERALLILAKIWGIHSGELPDHVRKQIRLAIQCRQFTPSDQIDIQLIQDTLNALGYIRTPKKRTLLEEAGHRVMEQRMPESAYNILKSKLQKVLSQRT